MTPDIVRDDRVRGHPPSVSLKQTREEGRLVDLGRSRVGGVCHGRRGNRYADSTEVGQVAEHQLESPNFYGEIKTLYIHKILSDAGELYLLLSVNDSFTERGWALDTSTGSLMLFLS